MTVTSTFTWDGLSARDVGARLGLQDVRLYAEVESTQDIAHELAEQAAPAGTLVVADSQRSGRGRQGRSWASQPGQGVWCTMIERPEDPAAFEVLSLRVGMRLAAALDEFAGQRVMLKWPNDLIVGADVTPSGARGLPFQKLGGILTEARWSGSSLSWVAVGVGVNVSHAGIEGAAALRPGMPRIDVLRAIVSAVRAAAASIGSLTPGEIDRFRQRDALAGKRILSPAVGVAQGIDATGALLVREGNDVSAHRSGSVTLENGS